MFVAPRSATVEPAPSRTTSRTRPRGPLKFSLISHASSRLTRSPLGSLEERVAEARLAEVRAEREPLVAPGRAPLRGEDYPGQPQAVAQPLALDERHEAHLRAHARRVQLADRDLQPFGDYLVRALAVLLDHEIPRHAHLEGGGLDLLPAHLKPRRGPRGKDRV